MLGTKCASSILVAGDTPRGGREPLSHAGIHSFCAYATATSENLTDPLLDAMIITPHVRHAKRRIFGT